MKGLEIVAPIGHMNSGKTTVQKYLIEKHGFIALNFADTLKDIEAPLFDWDRKLLEGDTRQSRQWREQRDEFWDEKLRDSKLTEGKEFTPRLGLQRFADVIKDYLGNDYFCHMMKKRIIKAIRDNNAEPIKIVIGDARFPQEIEYLRELGASIWRVKRKQTDPTEDQLSLLHNSETAWLGEKVDHVLENDGTVEELYNKILLELSFRK